MSTTILAHVICLWRHTDARYLVQHESKTYGAKGRVSPWTAGFRAIIILMLHQGGDESGLMVLGKHATICEASTTYCHVDPMLCGRGSFNVV